MPKLTGKKKNVPNAMVVSPVFHGRAPKADNFPTNVPLVEDCSVDSSVLSVDDDIADTVQEDVNSTGDVEATDFPTDDPFVEDCSVDSPVLSVGENIADTVNDDVTSTGEVQATPQKSATPLHDEDIMSCNDSFEQGIADFSFSHDMFMSPDNTPFA